MRPSLHVLHVASEYPPAKVYGLGRFVHALARAQAKLGDRVTVLTNSCGGREDDVLLDGVHVHRIAFPNPPRPADGHGEVFQFNHGAVSRLLDRLPAFADVDLVATHDWLTALAGRELATLLGVPLVSTFHDEVVGKHFGALPTEARVVRELEALTAQDATEVIANSEFVAEQLVRHYAAPRERLTAIPGGIDPQLLTVRCPERVADFRSALATPDEVLVLYVGRLDPEKGLGVFVQAALELGASTSPALRFVLAGSGRAERALDVALAPLNGLARRLGYVAGEALAYLYRAADVVVVPSLYEPFGLVALEAMLGEAAVAVAGAGGLPEIVRGGHDGVVVGPGDPRALADALRTLAHEPERRLALARAGRERALTTFSWESVAVRTREVYARALAHPRSVCGKPPVTPRVPRIAVVLLTRDAPLHAEAALCSLLRTRDVRLEIVVVEVGSDPATGARLTGLVSRLARGLGRGAPLTLLCSEAAEGGEATWIEALGRMDAPYVLLLGDETEVPDEGEAWLAALVWALEVYEASCVAPTGIGRDGTPHDQVPVARALASAGCEAPRPLPRADAPSGAEPFVDSPLPALLTRRSWALACAPALRTLEVGAVLTGLRRELRATTGRPAWQHPARLIHVPGEAARDPGAPFQATLRTGLPASIVVVAYRNLRLTREALEAVLGHTTPPFELVLVDNGSRDGTAEYFHELRMRANGRFPVVVLENEENLGYPVAANQGVRAARGDAVVLLNNDTRVRPGWLGALLAAARSREDVGIVSAKILDLDGRVQSAGGILHAPAGGFTIPGAGEDRLAPTVSQRREVDSASGPCMLLTRQLLLRVGVFDEVYSPGYFEDSDLCLRARAAGLTLLYEPGAEVFHQAKATADLVAKERGGWDVWGQFARNSQRFQARWRAQLAADERKRAAGAAQTDALGASRRVLLCYHRSATTTAAYCEAALRALGHEVVTAGRGQDLDGGPEVTAEELVAAAGGAIDLVLAIEGETFVPRELVRAPCRTALWAIDNHLHAANEAGWHLTVARAFDHVFAAQRDFLPALAAAGARVTWLPLACAPEVHAAFGGPGHEVPIERDLELVFVGHVRPFHARRRALLDRLARRFRLTEVQGAFGQDMARLFARARVVFNASLAGDLNMRVFEALASGGLLVTDRVENGLTELFADGEHLVLYGDDDLEQVVARALADEPTRAAIASRGQALALAHHTYVHRMRALLSEVARAPLPSRLGARGAREART